MLTYKSAFGHIEMIFFVVVEVAGARLVPALAVPVKPYSELHRTLQCCWPLPLGSILENDGANCQCWREVVLKANIAVGGWAMGDRFHPHCYQRSLDP